MAGKLYDKFAGFADALEQVGVRLRQATDEHEKAVGRLSQGSGNVIGQVEKLKALGAKTTKTIAMDYDTDDDALPQIGQSAADRPDSET